MFVRAVRLLHSKSKDSAAQLQSMLEEAINYRKGLGPGPVGAPPPPLTPTHVLLPNAAMPGKPLMGSGGGAGLSSSGPPDKRSLDRLKHELNELAAASSSSSSSSSSSLATLNAGPSSKRARLDSPRSSTAGFSSKSHTPSPTPPGSARGGEKHSSSEGEDAESMMDVNLELEGLNDCTCYVCKSFNQESGNKLMECHTCQNLFHQECHVPTVSNDEANDPRLVWNCTDCSKSLLSHRPMGKGSPTVSYAKGFTMFKGSPSSPVTVSRSSPSKSDYSLPKKTEKGLGSGKSTNLNAYSNLSAFKSSGKGLNSVSRTAGRTGSNSSGGSNSSSHKGFGSSSVAAGKAAFNSGVGSGANSMTGDKRMQLSKKKGSSSSSTQRKK